MLDKHGSGAIVTILERKNRFYLAKKVFRGQVAGCYFQTNGDGYLVLKGAALEFSHHHDQ